MSQNWTDDVYGLSHTGTTDLQNMENNFEVIKSLFSGTTTPSNNVAGMPWFDTTNKILKIRNEANSAWLGVLYGTTAMKIWIYSNSATDGWVIDSSVTGKVLAIKGGTQAYNVSGGTTAGTWTQPSHTLLESEIPSHDHHIDNDGAHDHTLSYWENTDQGNTNPLYSETADSGGAGLFRDTSEDGQHNHNCDNAGGGSSHNHGTTWRPSAAVGTMQYPNV